MAQQSVQRAQEAFDAYAASLAGGSAAELLGPMTSESLALSVAVPQTGLGWQHGTRALTAVDSWRRSLSFTGSATAVGMTSGHRSGSGRPTAAFEHRIAGRLDGEAFTTHACVVFEWDQDGWLVGLREYYGDNTTPPEAFAPYGLQHVFEVPPGRHVELARPPTLAGTAHLGRDDASVLLGQRAYDAFAVSVAEGRWAPYLDLLDPEVTFTLPIPGRMRGLQRGVAAAEEYHRWRWQDLGMRASLTQCSLMSNGPTVAVEFDTSGVIGRSVPIRHWAVYYFDVAHGRVVGFREYNGDEIT